jgi:hypothetical protein
MKRGSFNGTEDCELYSKYPKSSGWRRGIGKEDLSFSIGFRIEVFEF